MPLPRKPRAVDPVFAPIRAPRFHSNQDARIAELDRRVAEIHRQLQPHQPAEWERQKAILDERDALREKVRELEKQMDELIDSMTRSELTSTPSAVAVKPRRGRPKKKG